MIQKVASRPRIPLFTCMVAFAGPPVGWDAFSVENSDILWFAAQTNQKPGQETGQAGVEGATDAMHCWTLVSTPKFAVMEIGSTTMQSEDGAFRPQENGYLNGADGPSQALFDEFKRILSLNKAGGGQLPSPVYMQGQRWGSALPQPTPLNEAPLEEICGVRYDPSPMVLGGGVGGSGGQEFYCDPSIGLWYGGDFCSSRSPGIEAAVLSGVSAAKSIQGAGGAGLTAA